MGGLVSEILLILHNYNFERCRFWIDSEVVIYWLISVSFKFKPFVSVHIQEFQDIHPEWRKQVRYIPSRNNPAYCLEIPLLISQKLGMRENFVHFSKSKNDIPVEEESANRNVMLSLQNNQSDDIRLDDIGLDICQMLMLHLSTWGNILRAISNMQVSFI